MKNMNNMKKLLTILIGLVITISCFSQARTTYVTDNGNVIVYDGTRVYYEGVVSAGVVYTDDFESYTGDWTDLATVSSGVWYSAYGLITLATSGISIGQGARANEVTIYGYDNVFANNQYAEATLDVAADGWIGISVRVQGSTSQQGYMLVANRNIISLRRMDTGGGTTELGSYNGGTDHFTGGVVIRLEVEGTTLRCYDDGVLRITTTDATYSSGDAGLAGNANGTNYVRDWEGGDL